MGPGTRRTKAARVSSRALDHGRRALDALRRVGPGRWPGTITEVLDDGATVTVVGRIVAGAEDVAMVVVTVDGAPLAVAAPTGASFAEFRATVPRAAVPGTTVELGAVAVLRSGLVERVDGATWTLAPAPEPAADAPAAPVAAVAPIGWIDAPAEGSIEDDGVIELRGWVHPAVLVDRVEVRLDGELVALARPFSRRRDDVVAHVDDPAAVLAGFAQLVDISDRTEGERLRVTVDAVAAGERTCLGERRVVVGAAAVPADASDDDWIGALAARAAMSVERHVPDDRLDVIVFTHHLGLGGAQLWLWEVLVHLLALDDVTCTVVAPADGALRVPLEEAGARVHVMGAFPSDAGGYESKVRELVQLIAAGGHNVALVNTTGAFIGADAARRCKVPVAYAIHDHFPLPVLWASAHGRGALHPHVRRQSQLALEQAEAVCFVADATRALYAPLVPGERAATIPYGIPLDRIDERRATLDRDELRAAHGFGATDRVLVCVATVEERKAQADLVLALARLADRHPEAHVALVGGTGGNPYADAVVDLAGALGLADRVQVVPITPDVAPWYEMADGFVLCSDVESLPRSIMEAMAHEVLVLATGAGGVRELVEDGVTGLVCGAQDIGELERGLERLLTTGDEERRAMVGAAAARVRARHDLAAYPRRYERLLRELAADPGAPASLVD